MKNDSILTKQQIFTGFRDIDFDCRKNHLENTLGVHSHFPGHQWGQAFVIVIILTFWLIIFKV